MPPTNFKQSCIASSVVAIVVFALVCPVGIDRWRAECKFAALAVTMGLVLYADDAKLAVVTTLGIAALALQWKTRTSNEAFTVGAPHMVRPSSPNDPSGEDPNLLRSAGARVSFGAGSEPPLPDPGISVSQLKELTPPDLLHAAQSNEVPDRGDRRPF